MHRVVAAIVALVFAGTAQALTPSEIASQQAKNLGWQPATISNCATTNALAFTSPQLPALVIGDLDLIRLQPVSGNGRGVFAYTAFDTPGVIYKFTINGNVQKGSTICVSF